MSHFVLNKYPNQLQTRRFFIDFKPCVELSWEHWYLNDPIAEKSKIHRSIMLISPFFVGDITKLRDRLLDRQEVACCNQR